MLNEFLFVFWALLNVILLVYVCIELILLFYALRAKKQNSPTQMDIYPMVTVQLPIFNEKYVIERLIHAVCKLNYPKDKIEIQVLDDSIDETSKKAAKTIAQYQSQGLNIIHIQRINREGFKAGALDEGLKLSSGEYIAIFDADFIPNPNFLIQTIPYFQVKNVGVVQTRWTHINENFSILTRAQAIMLNYHFTIEQLGRFSSGAFINFNGTAGIWRKTCIEDAGGWKADTLTEDLDLSFRAQMKGWEFQYLFDVESPAELPITVDSYKTQQYRWSKGAAECVRKNTKSLWSSSSSLWEKLAGTVHLLNSSIFIIVFLLVLISPVIFWLAKTTQYNSALLDFIAVGSLITSFSITFLFYIGQLLASKNKWKASLYFIPNFYIFLALSLGISLYMVIGILEGYIGKASEFVRTPKFNIKDYNPSQPKKEYSFKKESNIVVFEFIIFIFGIVILSLGINYIDYFMINYGLLICIGLTLKIFFPKYIFKI